MNLGNPGEFTMLELYWAYTDYTDMLALTEEMLSFIARVFIPNMLRTKLDNLAFAETMDG